MTHRSHITDVPTQTFWNLPSNKRQALIDVAVEEFAANAYATASISRIVARAGIAKGSLYQYFADKRDLFEFLVELSNQTRLDYVRNEAPPELQADFWALLRWQIGASTRAALAYPLLTKLFYRAMDGDVPFRDELLDAMRALALDHWKQFLQRGIAEGAVTRDLDLDLGATLLQAVFQALGTQLVARLGRDSMPVHELDTARFQTPEVERILDQTVQFLQHGIAPRA
jgi:AcrR family transcriptional regulator